MDVKNDWIFLQSKQSDVPDAIVGFINNTFELYEARARVGEVKGIVFQVRSNEKNHTVPHIHASYGDYSISISIESCEVLAGNLPPKNQKIAQKWVKENREKLLTDWRNYTISATAHLTMSTIGSEYNGQQQRIQ